MTLKAEQCWKRAACCERIAENESAPMKVRRVFVRKANYLRIIGRLAALDEANASASHNMRAT